MRGLPTQATGLQIATPGIAIITVGGNDLLSGLVTDSAPGVRAFEEALDSFVKTLPIRPVYLANVYDPSFGDDSRNFLGVEPKLAGPNHARVVTERGDLLGGCPLRQASGPGRPLPQRRPLLVYTYD